MKKIFKFTILSLSVTLAIAVFSVGYCLEPDTDPEFPLRQLLQNVVSPPVVSFQSDSTSILEHDGSIVLPINVSGAVYSAITVNLRLSGSAASGEENDYSISQETITIVPGEDSKDIVVEIHDDNLYEGAAGETIEITLVDLVNAVTGEFATHTITIKDKIDVHVGGSGYLFPNSFPLPGYWGNGALHKLSSQEGEVNALIVLDGDIYAGGYMQGSSGKSLPGYWQKESGNWNWNLLPVLSEDMDGVVTSMAVGVNRSDIYAAGDSGDISDIFMMSVPGYWVIGESEPAWTSLPVLEGYGVNGYASSIAVTAHDDSSEPDVYIGGYMISLYYEYFIRPGYWKNGVWKDFSEEGVVTSVALLGDDIYAGGMIVRDASINPGYWKNESWIELSSQMGSVNSMIVKDKNNVFAGGCIVAPEEMMSYFRTFPVYWKNGELNKLSSKEGNVTSLYMVGDDLYAAGYQVDDSDPDSPIKIPGFWLNGTWNPLSSVEEGEDGGANTLVVVADDFIAGD